MKFFQVPSSDRKGQPRKAPKCNKIVKRDVERFTFEKDGYDVGGFFQLAA